jgi:tripartite-type tricarboxylate transporter receptor subunit TctC
MRGFYAAVLLILAGVAVAEPQTHPSRPITPIVPLPLGSSTDAAARIMAERMRIPL